VPVLLNGLKLPRISFARTRHSQPSKFWSMTKPLQLVWVNSEAATKVFTIGNCAVFFLTNISYPATPLGRLESVQSKKILNPKLLAGCGGQPIVGSFCLTVALSMGVMSVGIVEPKKTVTTVLAEPVQLTVPVAVAVKVPGLAWKCVALRGKAPLTVVEPPSPKVRVRLPQVSVPVTVKATDWPTRAEEGMAASDEMVPGAAVLELNWKDCTERASRFSGRRGLLPAIARAA